MEYVGLVENLNDSPGNIIQIRSSASEIPSLEHSLLLLLRRQSMADGMAVIWIAKSKNWFDQTYSECSIISSSIFAGCDAA